VLGGVGALARFLVDGAIAGRSGGRFPWGTLAVNLSGALLLGGLAGLTANTTGLRLFATGFLGAYTTFSTWAFETQRLAEDREGTVAWLNYAVSLAAGLGAAWVGTKIGGAL
jgi:CrcB protein